MLVSAIISLLVVLITGNLRDPFRASYYIGWVTFIMDVLVSAATANLFYVRDASISSAILAFIFSEGYLIYYSFYLIKQSDENEKDR